jgi:hypothetical protein
MHERHFEGRIHAICEKLRARFPALTPFDLQFDRGQTEPFLNRLSERLCMTRSEIGALALTIINEIINEPIPHQHSGQEG